MELGGFAMEEAIGHGSADALMEENEHEGNPKAFCGKAVGVAMAIALEQGVGFEFAKVVAKLGKGVAMRGKLVGGRMV